MNKNKVLIVGILLVIIIMGMVSLVKAGFRDTEWGMSIQEVKKAEDTPLTGAPETTNGLTTVIFGTEHVAHADFVIGYTFVNNKLCRGAYILEDHYDNGMTYFTKYFKIMAILTRKYGKSYNAGSRWIDETYKDKADKWGYALMLGDCQFYRQWHFAETTVTMLLAKRKTIFLTIEYHSDKLKELEDSAHNKIEQDKF